MFNGPLTLAEEIKIAQTTIALVYSYTSNEMTEEAIRIRNVRFAAERPEVETNYRMAKG